MHGNPRSVSIGIVCLLIAGCGGSELAFQRSGTPAMKLEIRPASTTNVEGWERMPEPYGQGEVFVSPNASLSNDHIVSSGVKADEAGHWLIVLKLNRTGQDRFTKLSADLATANEAATKRLAFLVDGRLISCPVV